MKTPGKRLKLNILSHRPFLIYALDRSKSTMFQLDNEYYVEGYGLPHFISRTWGTHYDCKPEF